MKKNILSYFLLAIIGISITSCGKRDEIEELSIAGSWTITERQVTTGDEFLDEIINNLIKLDNQDYIVKRTFTQAEYRLGSLITIATDRKTGTEQRNRAGTYRITNDSLYIDDEKFLQTVSGYTMTEKVLVTRQKLKKDDIDHIVEELGGDPNLIPKGTEGILRMKEIR